MNKLIEVKQQFQLISAFFLETVREPGVLFWGIIFPILMSLGLGIAFSEKTDVVRKVAIDQSSIITTGSSHSVIAEFLENNTHKKAAPDKSVLFETIIANKKLGNTTFLFQITDWQDAMVMLKRGNVNVILKENKGKIEYHFDPSNPDAQLTYLKLNKLLNAKEVLFVENIDAIKPLTVIGTRYIDFLVPGLMCMGIMMSCSGVLVMVLLRKEQINYYVD